MNQSVRNHPASFQPPGLCAANLFDLATEFMTHDQWRHPSFARIPKGFQL
jgi:hypothetical protein